MPVCEMPIPGKPNGDPLQTEFGSYLLQEGSQYTVRYKPWQQEASQAEVNSQPVLHVLRARPRVTGTRTTCQKTPNYDKTI